MTLEEKQRALIRRINGLGDCFEQYSYLIAASAQLPHMSEADKREEYLVTGCQSKVWLKLGFHDGRLRMEADSDTLVIRGALAIICSLLEGAEAHEVAEVNITLFTDTELTAAFTSGRSAGLRAIVETIQKAAGRYNMA